MADGEGYTPLHIAAIRGQFEFIPFLVAQGADISPKIRDFNPFYAGFTPLHNAANNLCHESKEKCLEQQINQSECIKSLISLGANIEEKDKKGNTPLHIAAKTDHWFAAKVLLDHNADVNARNNKGKTPLHLAALHGKQKVALLLLNHNAEVNAQDINGQTPLHKTAYPLENDDDIEEQWSFSYGRGIENQVKVAQLLLFYGANVNVKDNSGRTPLFLSMEQIHLPYYKKTFLERSKSTPPFFPFDENNTDTNLHSR